MILSDLVYEVFDDIRERNDGEVWVSCPFCMDNGELVNDTRYRLGINTETGQSHCFNCGFRTGSPDFLFQKINEKFNLDYIFSYGSGDKKHVKKSKKLKAVSLPKEFEPLWKNSGNDKFYKKAKKYLHDRGVTDEQIEEHFIGFCVCGKYAGRIIFPIYKKDLVVGFVGRDFTGDNDLRYLNSDGLKYLWNCRAGDPIKKAILVEGIFDALSVERALPEYRCIARLGCSLTGIQLKAVEGYKEITVWPDPNQAGVRGGMDTLMTLHAEWIGRIHAIIPQKGEKDPGDTSVKLLKKRFESRQKFSQATIYKLKASMF